MMTADEITTSRPPDRVTFGDWEFDPTDTDPPERRELVAVEGSLLRVTKYEERVHVLRLERRKRMEFWHEPLIPGGVTAEFIGDEIAYSVTAPILPREVARWEWEYRRRWQLR